jgi:uncharacterized Zn finger protein
MVHYNPTLLTIPTPPPTCPKCGSHRTEIVGLSEDGQTVVVRCNACGERSSVKLMATETEVVSGFAEPTAFSRVIEWQHT